MKDNNKKLLIIISVVFVYIIAIFVATKFREYIDYKKQLEISEVINTIYVPDEVVTEQNTERMHKISELQKENKDIVGWIEIQGTGISYPVLQGKDNDYYLNHSYKHEKIAGGSLFLDKDYDFNKPSDNLLVYGHRNKRGIMLEDLIKYKDESFYKEHSKIRFTTATEDEEYEILSAFYSRVYYQDEKDVFRYYYFVNAKNKKDYETFINNAKKESLYETGVTAEYGDQLLTLSTCEYSQDNGRFAVVAKKKNK